MQLRVAAQTDRGLVREINEDSLLASPPLVVVADGVGGHNAGEVASAIAVEVLAEWKRELQKRGATRLRDAAIAANRRIFTRAEHDTALRGMATTLTAAWMEAGTCTIAQVGDSRAYLIRDGAITQLTEDQTVVAELVRRGRISPEEAYDHPWRNRVFQALGNSPDVVVEILRVDLRVGDRLMLASDGLTDDLRDDEILAILQQNPDPEMAGRALVARAKDAGGTDNITVVLVDVTGNESGSRRSRRWRDLVGRSRRHEP
jgi:protein phosphatase